MNQLATSLRNAVRVFWGVGNHIARLAIWVLVLWPFLLLAVDTLGIWWVTTIVALIPPLAALIRVFALHTDPLVVPVASLQEDARDALSYLWTVIGLEFAWGVFLAILPTHLNWKLALFLVLGLIALAFLSFGHQGWFTKKVMRWLWRVAAIVVLIFLALGVWAWAKGYMPRTSGAVAAKAARADGVIAGLLGEEPHVVYLRVGEYTEHHPLRVTLPADGSWSWTIMLPPGGPDFEVWGAISGCQSSRGVWDEERFWNELEASRGPRTFPLRFELSGVGEALLWFP